MVKDVEPEVVSSPPTTEPRDVAPGTVDTDEGVTPADGLETLLPKRDIVAEVVVEGALLMGVRLRDVAYDGTVEATLMLVYVLPAELTTACRFDTRTTVLTWTLAPVLALAGPRLQMYATKWSMSAGGLMPDEIALQLARLTALSVAVTGPCTSRRIGVTVGARCE